MGRTEVIAAVITIAAQVLNAWLIIRKLDSMEKNLDSMEGSLKSTKKGLMKKMRRLERGLRQPERQDDTDNDVGSSVYSESE